MSHRKLLIEFLHSFPKSDIILLPWFKCIFENKWPKIDCEHESHDFRAVIWYILLSKLDTLMLQSCFHFWKAKVVAYLNVHIFVALKTHPESDAVWCSCVGERCKWAGWLTRAERTNPFRVIRVCAPRPRRPASPLEGPTPPDWDKRHSLTWFLSAEVFLIRSKRLSSLPCRALKTIKRRSKVSLSSQLGKWGGY